MTKKERLELAQWAMEYAIKSGADQASVSVRNQRDIEVQFREKKLEKLNESTQSSLNINIYTGQKYSANSTNDLRKDGLKTFIGEVVASTKYLNKDEFRSLPDPKYYPADKPGDLQIFDSNYEKIETEQRVKLAKQIEEIALAQSDRIISVTAGYSDSSGESVRVHSNGFVGETTNTIFSAGAEATVKDENGGRPEDWAYGTVRFFNDLPAAEVLGKEAVDRALRKMGQAKIATGKYDVIIENRAAGRIIGMLQGALSGRALQQKMTYLDGMLDKKIGSDLLTITDDPFIAKGLSSRIYDGEGLAARRRSVVEKGVLKSYFIDDYYGRKLKMEPTSGSTSNLIFESGQRSLQELVKNMSRGILITDFIGGNSNSTTGDFSYGVMGLFVENGVIVKPVNEMNLSGNQKEFWNQLVEMGNDVYTYSSIYRPSLRFEGLQFSGL
jgi:PmbA protein